MRPVAAPAAVLVSALVLAFPALGLGSSLPTDDETLLFILDASGSMWGRVEGDVSKIEVAREVMGDLVAALPADQRAGLVAYGHRRKGDCADIELVHAPAAGQADELAAAVNRLIPRGKTPIADALTRSARVVNSETEAARLVLVSDGKESCDGDPCAVARALRESGADLQIFVVGFDVADDEVAELQCIADAGGGQYFDARDSASLAAALTAIQQHVVSAEPLPEPVEPEAPEVETAATETNRIRLNTIGTIELQPADWVRMPPRYWKIVDAETGEEVGSSNESSVRIAAGTYQIVWRQAEHQAGEVPLTATVRVEGGETAPVALDTGIRLVPPEQLSEAYYWRLIDDQGQVAAQFAGSESFEAQLVPAGRYELVWRQTEHGTSEADLGPVEIAPGELTPHVLGSGFVLQLPEWLAEPDRATLTDGAGREYAFSVAGVHPLAPGDYTLSWRQTEHGHSPVTWGTVTVPEEGFPALSVNSGLVFIAGDQPPPYRVIAVNAETGEEAILGGNWGPMPLPPGTYSLYMQQKQHGGDPILLIEGLQLAAGQLLELEL